MTTVTQAVEKRQAGPVSVMFTSKKQFAAVLPASVDVDAFLGTMAGALYTSEDLMKAAAASPDSLYTALMRCASLGHLPGTDEFYLVPRKRKGRPEVQGIEGYRGIVERMYRSGAVASVVVREVCANDRFHFIEGVDAKPVHSTGGEGSTGGDFFGAAGSRNRGDMVGVYAYAILTTGAVSRVVLLTRDDVMAAREASDSKDSDYSPWNRLDGGKDHPEFTGRSMWWKTAARRLEPWVPTSAEYRREMLRASSAAAEAASTRFAAQPAANGNGAPPEPVYEAEIVSEEPQPERPARPRTGDGQPATPKALEEMSNLLGSLPLGPDDSSQAANQQVILDWLTGGWKATRAQVRDVTSTLKDQLRVAEGDMELAASKGHR